MMRQKILTILALLCTFVQGAWAQNYDVWDGHSKKKPGSSNYMYDVTLYINSAAELAWVMNHYTDDYYYWSDWLGRTLVTEAYTSSININADIDMSAANWIPLGGKDGGNIHYGYNGS